MLITRTARYTDCLVALDFGETEEEMQETRKVLQLPICRNLAACLLEEGRYERCVAICNVALDIEPLDTKARMPETHGGY